MHIYFAIYAFTTFKLWIALFTFLAPIVGDLVVAGAAIANHNWLPIIWLIGLGVLADMSTKEKKKEKTNE